MNTKLVRWLRLVPLLLAAWLASPAAFALDAGDILVVSTKGEVHLTQNGAAAKIRAGVALALPAAIRTGRDGTVELKQGATTVSVGPDTLLEFPALEKAGGPIDRIVQPRGNAFYSIGKRDGRKLRVETPYLVGVVKGTQFNVAAQDESTTISLFEGLLEIRATDDSAVVDIKAGEIASRRRGDKNINVIKMEPGKTPTTAPIKQGGSNDDSSPTPPREGNGSTRPVLVDRDRDNRAPGVVGAVVDTVNGTQVSGSVSADVRTPVAGVGVDTAVDIGRDGVAVSAAANVNAVNVVDTSVNANVDVGANGVSANVDTGTRVDAGVVSAGVDTSVAVDVGASGVSADVSTGTTVDAGVVSAGVDTAVAVDVGASGVSADVSTGTTVDAGVVSAGIDTSTSIDVGTSGIAADVGTSTTVDTGPVSTSIDTGTSLDLGTSGVTADVGTSAVVDAGPVSADIDTGTAVDLGAGTVDTSLDTGVTAGPVDVPVAADVGLDVSSGTVDLGVTVAGVDLDVGVDLGLGSDAADTGSSTPDTTTDTTAPIIDVGGLLDGLLRRPGRN